MVEGGQIKTYADLGCAILFIVGFLVAFIVRKQEVSNIINGVFYFIKNSPSTVILRGIPSGKNEMMLNKTQLNIFQGCS
jgi:hypothetical protein